MSRLSVCYIKSDARIYELLSIGNIFERNGNLIIEVL
jgi:hypothetical protein